MPETPTTIRDAVQAARTQQETYRSRGPGPGSTRCLIATIIATPMIWATLVWAAVLWHDQPVTVAHLVWVGSASTSVIAAAIMAATWIMRRDSARQHDEMLIAMDVVCSRSLTHAEAVGDTVDRLAAALPGGGKVTQIR
ncbi:hypothetical protein GA0074692_6840 [Micromonospora pallida]|uniref:Uncharacterized protein n=1 Tax=Micromonospora pallida TaxID=145854 RepID=A0A1C6TP39_9ACTN|nr:hypothetical protein GA0074692_6685 [Micromonospora pallida]SCL43357.1 hypothetical protein GA0074692_6840 [Micromonospora pallida]